MNEPFSNNPTSPATPSPARSGSGLAIAALILGIVSLVLSLLVIGAIFAIVGIILGAIHLRRRTGGRAMAWWGIGLSIVAILASVGLGALYYTGYQKVRAMMSELESDEEPLTRWEGIVAPDITVSTLEGEAITLSDLRGKRVVLDFWATWCPPCVKEIPHFIQLINETSRDDLVIIGISEEEPEKLKAFAKKHSINYPIALPSDLPPPYRDVRALPTTFFIDRNGVIQSVLVGYHDLESLREHAMANDFEGEPKSSPETDADTEVPEVKAVPLFRLPIAASR